MEPSPGLCVAIGTGAAYLLVPQCFPCISSDGARAPCGEQGREERQRILYLPSLPSQSEKSRPQKVRLYTLTWEQASGGGLWEEMKEYYLSNVV